MWIVGAAIAAAGSCTLSTEGTAPGGTGTTTTTSSGTGGDIGSGGHGGHATTTTTGTAGGGGAGGGPPSCTEPHWAQRLAPSDEFEPAGAPDVVPVGVAFDPSDRVVAALSFKGAASIGGDSFDAGGRSNALVVKLHPDGAPAWSRNLHDADNSKNELATAVAVDGAGNALVTGVFESNIDLGGPQLISFSDGAHAFALKLSPAGDRLWDAALEDAEWRSIAVQANGDAVVAGHITAQLVVGGIPLPFGGARDVVVARLNGATGARAWIKSFGDGAIQEAHGVAVNGAGEILVTGSFAGTLAMPPAPPGPGLTSLGGTDAFVAKLAPDGTPIWLKQIGGVNDQSGRAIAVDPAGNILVAGVFREAIQIDGDSHTTASNADNVFVTKLAAGGNLLWSRSFGDAGQQDVRGLAVGAAGRIYLAGHFYGEIDFGGGPIVDTAAGKEDAFVAILEMDGGHVYSGGYGEASKNQRASAIAARGCSFVVAGGFDDSFGILGESVVDQGGYSSFIARVIPPLP